uniref:N/A n=1 Tax=Ganoderma boninense TaxID=34458 RepID=A0A5K1JVI8_9APHY|nr:N/A [Ganoderma boninense]
MIRHAMTFASVQRIVYSTCSVHSKENEHVVRQALESDEAINGKFKLASQEEVLPTWHRRGIPEEMGNAADAESLVRCSPGEDRTNGFFVGLFIRAKDEEDEWTGIVVDAKKRKAPIDEVPDQVSTKRKRKKKKKSAANPLS